jgi:hypothetical protein
MINHSEPRWGPIREDQPPVPPPMYGYRPSRGYIALIIIGLIIFIVGGIVSISWGYITPDYNGYSDHVRIIVTTGNMI